jgi:tripartite ATP-independent transporter DctP family solute receptor
MVLIERRQVLRTAAAATALSAPFIRRARAADFTFKAATGLAPNHPTNIRLQEAADAIAKETDGRMVIRVFPNAQLGGEVDLLNQVRSGAVEMYLIGGLVISAVVPMAALDGTGFAFTDYKQVWPAMDGKLGAYIRAAIMKSNLYVTETIWDLGFRQITNSVRPINTLADLSGMKIRVPGAAAYSDLFKALGAAPANIQYPEVYSALQTHIVDGQENPLGLIVTSKFYEVQKYCSFTNHMWNGFWCLANGRAWRRLPPDLQTITEKHLNAAGKLQRQDLANQDASYRDALVKAGIALNTPDTTSFRARLKTAGYYDDAKRKFGEEAWALLNEAGGGVLG